MGEVNNPILRADANYICLRRDVETKAQWIRLLDVFAIGPVMTWAGVKLQKDYKALGIFLAASGVATILFNGRNWLYVREAERRTPEFR